MQKVEAIALKLWRAGKIYYDPEAREWQTAEQYLCGPIQHKITQVTRELEEESDLPDWILKTLDRNQETLERIKPDPLMPDTNDVTVKLHVLKEMGIDGAELDDERLATILSNTISIRLGMSWIPRDVIEQFAQWLLETESPVKIHFSRETNTWEVNGSWGALQSTHCTTTYGTKRRDALKILEDCLLGRTPLIYDESHDGRRVVNDVETQAALDKMEMTKEKFSEWIWGDQEQGKRKKNVSR